MNNISSQSLFHFTNSANALVSILTSGFIPRFSMECFAYKTTHKTYAIPMICFCDIPISQIDKHMSMYGRYGLGMTKEWAIKQGLNPVIYLEDNSTLNTYTHRIAGEIWCSRCIKQCKEETELLRSCYWHILRYVKRYSGDFYRGKNKFENYIFYNEREWRYIPEVTDLSENSKQLFYLTKKEYEDEVVREKENIKIKKYILKFEPEDIEYIIVKNKKELDSMIELITDNGKLKKKKLQLISKLLAADQILKDF